MNTCILLGAAHPYTDMPLTFVAYLCAHSTIFQYRPQPLAGLRLADYTCFPEIKLYSDQK